VLKKPRLLGTKRLYPIFPEISGNFAAVQTRFGFSVRQACDKDLNPVGALSRRASHQCSARE